MHNPQRQAKMEVLKHIAKLMGHAQADGMRKFKQPPPVQQPTVTPAEQEPDEDDMSRLQEMYSKIGQ